MKLAKYSILLIVTIIVVVLLCDVQNVRCSENKEKVTDHQDDVPNLDIQQALQTLKGPVVDFFSKMEPNDLSKLLQGGIELLQCVDLQLKSEEMSSVNETIKGEESSGKATKSKRSRAAAAASAFASDSEDIASAMVSSTDPSPTQPSSTLVDLLLDSVVSCATVKLAPVLLQVSSLVLSTGEVSKVDPTQSKL